jgi:hypothetical protein
LRDDEIAGLDLLRAHGRGEQGGENNGVSEAACD